MPPYNTQRQCSFYAVNSCKKGDNCPFAHGQPQLPLVPATLPCIFWKNGKCSKGNQCKFLHDSYTSESPTSWRKQQPHSALPDVAIPLKATCIFWKANRCSKGDQCKFLHDDRLEPEATRRSPPVFGRKLGSRPEDLISKTEVEDEHKYTTGEHIQELEPCPDTQGNASCLPRCVEDDSRPPEPGPSSQTTIERLFSDRTRARIGPGGEIKKVLTAFESHRVMLSNLPDGTSQKEMISMAEDFGPVKSVVLTPSVSGTKTKAEIEYLNPDSAKAAAIALDGLELRSRQIVAQLNLRLGETGAADLRSSTLKMSWFAPSRVAYAHYDSIHEARDKALKLDGKSFIARKVSTAFQQPSAKQTCSFTVIVKGLPLHTPVDELKRFCGSESVQIGQANYHGKAGTARVHQLLETFGPLDSFDLSCPTPSDLKVKALVRFTKPEHAAAAYKQLQGQPQSFLGGAKTWLTLLHSAKYNVSKDQFGVLGDSLRRLQTEDIQSAKVRVYDKDEAGRPLDPVCVRIYGDDPKTLGRLKTKVEKLLAGEEITHEGTEEFILWKGSQPYVEQIHRESGAYVRRDIRRRTLHVSGSSQQRESARKLILDKMKELQAQRHVLQLTKSDLGRLLQGELARLESALGEDILFLDVRNRTLTVRGDDEAIQVARLALKAVAAAVAVSAKGGGADCPVCFCEVTNHVGLACGHGYCYACLRHYLGSAENFPVKCLGEDGRCELPIPLSTITHILRPDEEIKFFDTAFLAFIHQHPTDFHHCPTPDCTTIYRPGEPGQILRCPSCLARICPSCHVEFHEGLTCAEQCGEQQYNQTGGELAFQQWKEANNVQACPNCKADIEKSYGCNHMECIRCRTHMCWVCRATFPNGTVIYDHMQRAHGGIGLEEFAD